jgi:hypothetical protein
VTLVSALAVGACRACGVTDAASIRIETPPLDPIHRNQANGSDQRCEPFWKATHHFGPASLLHAVRC